MELQEKIIKHFEGKVVRKDLASQIKGNLPVPIYVLEYLLGQECAINDEEIIKAGVDKVRNIITNNYVNRSDAEVVKSKIRDLGSYKIIDKINVELNDKKNQYEADFANLGIRHVPTSDNIVKKNPKLLSGGGVWCIVSMSFDHSQDAEIRWVIEDLKPIQVSGINLNQYIDARKDFTTEEWLDLLMHSIGLNPEFFNKRGKLIQLSRLIAHVENNYNFIELGPKGTGKSHIFRHLSPHGVLVSGGDVSSARLFVNNVGNKLGLVGYWDVVGLDEFEQQPGKKFESKMVDAMQDYLADQAFNRGKETYQATASMVFVGNTKHTVPYMLKNSQLFESIPTAFLKGAFLDRVHYYSPGWEVRILKGNVFSNESGFIVDYLAEILKELRRFDYTSILDEYVKLHPSFTQRDKIAVRKTFSGLVKLIYPNKVMTEQQAIELIDFAYEGRRRVKDQLYIIDETFKNEPVTFSYTINSSGIEKEIETLEVINYRAERKIITEDTEQEDTLKEPVVGVLKPKQVSIKDNQTGISYKSLFADYLKCATEITLQDPYIRLPYQFKNLLEFCVMLVRNKEIEEEVNLHLVTWNNAQYMQDSIYTLEEIKENVGELGINLTWEFLDLHDRFIKANNGWKITLGRGLDIFEPREGRFNIGDIYQEKRKCKNCEIIYLSEN